MTMTPEQRAEALRTLISDLRAEADSAEQSQGYGYAARRTAADVLEQFSAQPGQASDAQRLQAQIDRLTADLESERALTVLYADERNELLAKLDAQADPVARQQLRAALASV